jgi:predicted acylesterase/phospholipase RssA
MVERVISGNHDPDDSVAPDSSDAPRVAEAPSLSRKSFFSTLPLLAWGLSRRAAEGSGSPAAASEGGYQAGVEDAVDGVGPAASPAATYSRDSGSVRYLRVVGPQETSHLRLLPMSQTERALFERLPPEVGAIVEDHARLTIETLHRVARTPGGLLWGREIPDDVALMREVATLPQRDQDQLLQFAVIGNSLPGELIRVFLRRVQWRPWRSAWQRWLIRDLPEPDTALALSGGGAKGSFEAGALLYLKSRWSELNVGGLCGTSVGSVNLLPIAEAGAAGIDRLISIYLALRSESDMFVREAWVDEAERLFQLGNIKLDVEALLNGEGEPKFVPPFDPVGSTIMAVGSAGWSFIGELLGAVQNTVDYVKKALALVIQSQNLYHLGPLESTIRTRIDFSRLGSIPFRLCMVQLEDGDVWYMDENGDLLKHHASDPLSRWELVGTYRDNIVAGVLASAAAPGLYRAIRLTSAAIVGGVIDGHFVDGGLRDILPVRAAAELGASRIIAIGCNPLTIEARSSFSEASFLRVAGRSLGILTRETYREEVEPDAGWSDDVERIFIYPSESVHGSQTVHPGLLRINIAYGYMVAFEQYKGQTDDWGDIAGQWILVAALCGLTITALRVRVLELEEKALQMFLPVGGLLRPIFRAEYISQIRDCKRQLMEVTITRFRAAGEDLASLPLTLPDGPAGPESIHQWWESWERHKGTLDSILGEWDLWEPLWITNSLGLPILEGSVPPRPVTNEFPR